MNIESKHESPRSSRSPSSRDEKLADLMLELSGANGDTEILYSKDVMLIGKKDEKSEKIVAIGSYRFLLVDQSRKKLQLLKGFHYFDLREIESPSSNEITLIYKDGLVRIEGNKIADEIFYYLNEQFSKIAIGMSRHLLPIVASRLGNWDIPRDAGIDAGFLACYRSFCNYHRVPCSTAFVHYVESIKSNGSMHDLILNECSGIEPKTAYTFDLAPVASSIRCTKFFKSVVLKDISRREAINHFSSVIENRSIQRLVLSGVDGDPDGFVMIGDALRTNVDTTITELDLSHNEIEDKGANSIASGLRVMAHGLTHLNLSHCQIQPKGISAIMKALEANQEASVVLSSLNMSHNNFGGVGSLALASWLASMKLVKYNQSALTSLNLSSCMLDLYPLFVAIKDSIIDKLKALDISNNKMDKRSENAICSFLEETPALEALGMNTCVLLPDSIECLMNSITKNTNPISISLSMRENDFGSNGGSGAKILAKAIRHAKSLHTIDLRSNGLKKEGMLQIMKSVEQNSTIKGLDLSDNLKGKNAEVVKGLSDMLGDSSGLETLNISENALGKDIAPFFKSLTFNHQLRSLNICGNQMGDTAATSLAEALGKNTTLKKLDWDENQITLGGWQAFGAALKNNRTLSQVAAPEKDIGKVVSGASAKDKMKQREKIAEVMSQISVILKTNGS